MPADRKPVSLLARLREARSKGKTELALLIDPDKVPREGLPLFMEALPLSLLDYLLVGGSLLMEDRLDEYIEAIRRSTDLPVVLFPGHAFHLSLQADALLFLSLLSGRNPELLVGQQVQVAARLYRAPIEVVPTAYLLVDGGRATSVSYMSQTLPIPRDKPDIAFSTAFAGQLLGMQLVYLEAGSGARYSVPPAMVRLLRQQLDLPLVVGGGIRNPEQAVALARAGATLLVVGTAAESDPSEVLRLAQALRQEQRASQREDSTP